MIPFKVLNAQLDALLIRSLQLTEYCRTRHCWRGKCPFHASGNPRLRSLAINLQLRKFHCHRCKTNGDMLDLWAGVRGISLYRAAEELVRAFC